MSKLLSCSQGHQWPLFEHGKPSPDGHGVACPVCGAAPALEGLGAPAATAAALGRLRDELQGAAGRNLAGLVIYGSLARGRYHAGKSDINLVVLLRDVSATSLAVIAPALRSAWRALRVEPLILMPAEISRVAADFPTKFLDIKAHHVVLAGEDPFVGLVVAREHLRTRLEQALRNLSLRLRRRYVALVHDPAAVPVMLANMARPLALELATLLHLAGHEVPAEDRTVAIFEATAKAFGWDAGTLTRLAALRRDAQPASDLADLFTGVLAIIAQAADRVAQMKE